jgi:hypothetical protein
MALPAWDDGNAKFGTKIRVALWLLTQVGVGNIFTKAQLRDAFPGVEQVDRRMRDLRQHGWMIHTNKEDASLTPNELRFVQPGEEVWKPGKAKPAAGTLTSKQRMAIMAGDDFMCVVCGIAGGETYADMPHEAAQLSITRRASTLPSGQVVSQYVTECKRCKAGDIPGAAATLAAVMEGIDSLDLRDRQTLASWVTAGRRRPSKVETLWTQYRRLPAEARDEVENRLRSRP